MKKRKKNSDVFNLSFLDCICCGFGAIILLFIVSMGVWKTETITLSRILENTVLQRKMKLADYQIAQDELDVLLGLENSKRKRLESQRNTLDALLAKLKENIADKEKAKELFVTDMESLEKELAAFQTEIEVEQKIITPTPIGVPVESNYIAFVIDTSGSMRDSSTNLIRGYVVKKFEEVVNAYPEVKGIQLFDADGNFIMGSRMGGKWLLDSPEMRSAMVRQVRLYPYNSASNPVPGIRRAIRQLYDPNSEDMEFGIYVFGDEFAGKPQGVLASIRRINTDKDGERIARINAIGFPNLIRGNMLLGQTGLKFAQLMYEITYENGGAFIALERQSLDDVEREMRDRFPTPMPRPRRSPLDIWGI